MFRNRLLFSALFLITLGIQSPSSEARSVSKQDIRQNISQWKPLALGQNSQLTFNQVLRERVRLEVNRKKQIRLYRRFFVHKNNRFNRVLRKSKKFRQKLRAKVEELRRLEAANLAEYVVQSLGTKVHPGKAFQAGVGVQFLNASERANFTIKLQLPTELVAGFSGVAVSPYLQGHLSASSSLNGNELTVQVTDNGEPAGEYLGHSNTPLFYLVFNDEPSLVTGNYVLDVTEVTATDLAQNPLPYNFDLIDGTVQVSDPVILTASLPDAVEGQAYAAGFLGDFLKGEYTWSLVAGSLPPGLELQNTGSLLGTVQSGASGVYSFTVELSDSKTSAVATQQFNIQVTNDVPRIFYVTFHDVDSNEVVSDGDQLKVIFLEDVQFEPNAIQAFSSVNPSDSFGAGASVAYGSSQKELVITLGPGASIDDMGTAQIQFDPFPGLVRDLSDLPAQPGVFLIKPPASSIDLRELVVGETVSIPGFFSAPFSNLPFTVTELPDGLSYNSQTGRFEGVPTTASFGSISVSVIDSRTGEPTQWDLPYRVWDQAPPSLRVEFPQIATDLKAGEVVAFTVVTSDQVNPVNAFIELPGGETLNLIEIEDVMAGSDRYYVIPDLTSGPISGDLKISQGGNEFLIQPVSVTSTAPIAGYGAVISGKQVLPSAHPSYPAGFLLVSGVGLSNVDYTKIAGTIVAPLTGFWQDSFMLFPLSEILFSTGISELVIEAFLKEVLEEVHDIQVDPETVCIRPPNVDGDADSLRERVEQGCAIIEKALELVPSEKDNANKVYRERVIGLLKAIAMFETGFAATGRVQNSSTLAEDKKAYGLFQIEPAAASTALNSAQYGDYCQKQLAKASNLSAEFVADIAEALADMPDGSKCWTGHAQWLCHILKVNDLAAAVLARCVMRSATDPVDGDTDDPKDPTYVDDVKDEWFEQWKRAASEGNTEQEEKDSKTDEAEALKDALGGNEPAPPEEGGE